jgi:membrane-associated protease RseP (regulator of RpoE activity)
MVYFSAAFAPAGVFVQQVPGGPAEAAGISGTITAIDNYQVRTQDDIRAALANYQPGDTVQVTTVSGDLVIPSFQLTGADFFIPKQSIVTEIGAAAETHSVVLSTNPQRGGAYMGVSPALRSYSFAGSQTDFFIYQNVSMLMLWIFVFSLGVGIVNILPIKPLDGGLLFEELVGHFTNKTKYLVRTVSGIMLLVLLFNLVGPILA